MIKQYFLIGLLFLSGTLLFNGCAKNDASEPTFSPEATATIVTATPLPTQAPLPKEENEEEIKKENDTAMIEQTINYEEYFSISKITEDIFSRMKGKSYPNNCTLDLETLRYVTVAYLNFDGEICKGELIVNAQIAEDVLSIFKELLGEKYPIESITLIDEYNADDNLSMAANNSSAFCYRVISGTDRLSNHSFGLAIDINPLYNPYIKNNGQVLPEEAEAFADRTDSNPYYITSDDICVRIFKKYGFTWGGDWTNSKDYQHFEKKLSE